LELGQQSAGEECSNITETGACTSAPRGCRWSNSKCEELWTQLKLDTLCHPCTLVYAYRAIFVLNVMDDFNLPDPNDARRNARFGLSLIAFTVNGVCSTDLSDSFCMIKLQQTPADFSCAGLGGFLKTVGCCAPSAIELYQGLCNVDKAVHPTTSNCQTSIDAINMQVSNCPSIKLGLTCAKLKFLIVHQAILSGITSAWFAANKDRLIDEVKKVIAFAVGIDIALITDLKIIAAVTGNGRRLLAAGDLQVTTTITVPNYGASLSANTGLIGELDPLGVNDAIQSTTPGGSLGQPTIVGQSTTNVAVLPSSDAFSVSPFYGALLLVGIFFH